MMLRRSAVRHFAVRPVHPIPLSSAFSSRALASRFFATHVEHHGEHHGEEHDEKPLRVFTREEVAKHASDNDCWIIINNKVYNVSTWADIHPGGRSIILQVLPLLPPQMDDSFPDNLIFLKCSMRTYKIDIHTNVCYSMLVGMQQICGQR